MTKNSSNKVSPNPKSKPPKQTTCSLCGEVIEATSDDQNLSSLLLNHKWTEHKDTMTKVREAGTEATRKKEDQSPKTAGEKGGKPDKTVTTVKTDNPVMAQVFSFVPKRFELTSLLIHQVKHITETDPDWGPWPVLPMEQWLDTYFYEVMLKFGYQLGAYVKLPRTEGGDDGDGDGRKPGNGGGYSQSRRESAHAS